MKKQVLFFLGILFISGASLAQTPQQRQWIVNHYNLKKLHKMAARFGQQYHTQRQRALAYARAHNIPLVITDKNGHKSYLDRMNKRGDLIYLKTISLESIETISAGALYPNGGLGLEITGEGMTVGEWDGGKVRGTHELLNGKISYGDNVTELADHSTHVAGIIVGKKLPLGTGALAKGVAYGADLTDYDWFNDISEMTTAASNGLLASNHSYGLDLTQPTDPESYLGWYGPQSHNADVVAYQAPYYSIVVAAGNDRDAGYSVDGFNILAAEMSTSKNDIVVAAVKDVSNYNGPSSVNMTSFSSWGPTNDNRIKPDISADGFQVLSSLASADNAYGYESGTSMATPSVTGGIILLQQLASELNNGEFLRSSTIKALIVATALETGSYPGPDPKFGWGLMNVKGAAQLMIDNDEGNGPFYKELALTNSDKEYDQTIKADGTGKLKVTIAWTDPAGSVYDQGSDEAVLVNDLDLRVIDPDGTTYYPWRLNPNNSGPALNDGDNDVDNVEKVEIDDPQAGDEYTLEVTAKNFVFAAGKQDFALVVNGVQPSEAGVTTQRLKDVEIYPNPARDHFNIRLKNAVSKMQVAVFDINGRRVLKRNFNHISGNQSIPVQTLQSGLYFVKIKADGKSAVKKLIVK